MTARQVWEGMLTELSKVNAPSMLLQDFNYFFNKAINQYINKGPLNTLVGLGAGKSKLFGATYEVDLPQDYLHILNCVCIYKVNKNWKCYNKGDIVQFAAKRLTADSWSVIVNDYYNRPLPERPYFYIHNVNQKETIPTNPYNGTTGDGTDMTSKKYGVTISQDTEKAISSIAGEGVSDSESKVAVTTGTTVEEGKSSNFPRTITLNDGETIDAVNKETAYRYGNASKVRMEVRYGHDDTVFTLVKVFVDYIKSPQYIRLTQEQVNLTEDTSQIMEFPDYVCQEIINELTMLVMENTADPRLQTNTTVTQSIANPAQQQAPQQPQQRS